MEENILDLRGRPSPEPLVEARRRIANGDGKSFVVLLTDERCAENLAGLAASVGWSSRAERTTDGSLRVALRSRRSSSSLFVPLPTQNGRPIVADVTPPPTPRGLPALPPRTVVVLASRRVGDGEAGEQILQSFLEALPHTPVPPDAIVLLNDGARLLEAGSSALRALEELSRQGTRVLVGASCALRLGLSDDQHFAKAITMTDLAPLLLSAERIVRL